MTNFVKDQFNNCGGGYIEYQTVAGSFAFETRKFVARFKYAKSGKGSFITFLIKHFTVEEYFDRMAAGETPLKILESKGYLLPHIKKILKENGYPLTIEGRDSYINDSIAQRATIIEG